MLWSGSISVGVLSSTVSFIVHSIRFGLDFSIVLVFPFKPFTVQSEHTGRLLEGLQEDEIGP